MNYFELFDLPVSLKVDSSQLSSKFFALSRKYHPDYFINEPAVSQAAALERSSMLNKAWKTFQNPDETIRYVLQLKDLIEEEEKYELPPDFLMEVMEINEQLMDADDEAVKGSSLVAVDELEAAIYEPVSRIIENYDDATTSTAELLLVKEYYYKKKYLDRIRKQLAGMA